MQVPSLGQEDPLERGMTAHSSILTWRIPWKKESGGLQSIVLQSQTQVKQISMHTGTQGGTGQKAGERPVQCAGRIQRKHRKARAYCLESKLSYCQYFHLAK